MVSQNPTESSAPRSPLTGRAHASAIETRTAAQLSEEWQKRFNIDIKDELNGATEVTMYRCNDTGLLFFSPADIVGSAHLYSLLQPIEGYYREEKWEHEFALEQMAPTDKVLEVGCGTGGFINIAARRGLHVRGIEINEEAVFAAKSAGLSVEHEQLSDFADREPESMDVLCAFQVLEHVPDPLAFIAACLKCVRPGGLLIFGVPNSKGFLRYQFEPLDWPPHHTCRWSGQAFQFLCKLLPLRVVSIAYEPVTDWIIEFYAASALQRAGLSALPGSKLLLRIIRRLGRTGLRRYLHWGHSICAVLQRK